MRNKILEDLKNAMKAQDKVRLSVIRMVKGAIQMEELNVKHELTDDEVIGIISKQVKTRKESIIEFEKGNRTDLIEQTEAEIKILEEYLPEPLTIEEIEKIIDEAINEIKPSGMSDMGKIMGKVNPLLKGRADMGNVSKMIKERITK